MLSKRKHGLLAVIFSIIIGTMFLSFAVNSKADSLVINGSTQMSIGGSQTFTASGGTGPYTWSKSAGGGNINPSTGAYDAPATNEGCADNPTICVKDSTGQAECVNIAVNSWTGQEMAVRTWVNKTCTCTSPPYICNGFIINKSYNCAGDLAYECTAGRQYSDYVNGATCDQAYNGNIVVPQCYSKDYTINYLESISPVDLRTDYIKQQGCCPSDLAGNAEPNSKGDPPCQNIPVNSTANFKSGNLYHDQQVGNLTLSYNSIDTYDGPLGKKWTHNYDLKLTALSNTTLKLKTEDGNVIYFHLSGGVYYPDAISGDTSQIIRNTDNTYTRTLKSGITQAYSTTGLLTGITDRNGNATTLTYSGGNLASITDQNNRTTTITTTSGKITAITDALNRTHSLTYSGDLLTAIADPLGNAWHYTYDTAGRMLTKVDPLSNTITYAYDASGRLSTSTDPENKTRTLNYTASGTTNFTEKDGGVWTYTYDPIFTVKTSQTDPLGNTTYYTYDCNAT